MMSGLMVLIAFMRACFSDGVRLFTLPSTVFNSMISRPRMP